MEESDFVQKYGAIDVEYIPPVQRNVIAAKPYALNYFHQGKLYRTATERSSAKLELFLDLLYVGIVASIAEPLTEHSTGAALLQYCILFVPVFTVWLDITSFMNYYFNDDLLQRLFLLWITILLMIYANNSKFILENHKATAMCVVPYMLCRLSFAVTGWIISFYESKHREQLRLYGCMILITTPVWIAVIFTRTRAKVGISIALLVLEQICFTVAFHPKTKKLMKVKYGTALNIEHFVERFASFYIIAIGEFLYTIVGGNPTGEGISVKMWKAILILCMAYIFMWLYFNGDCSNKLIHALRRSAFTAMAWVYLHIPLIASLILTADAAAELLKLDEVHLLKEYEEELSLYGLSFFFTGGVLVALVSLSLLALCDGPLENELYCQHRYRLSLEQISRVLPRIPVALIVICLSLAELKPARLLGLTAMLLAVLFFYELGLLVRADSKKKNNSIQIDTTSRTSISNSSDNSISSSHTNNNAENELYVENGSGDDSSVNVGKVNTRGCV